MDMVYHGGQCCGMRHIYGMDNVSVDELDRRIRELDNEAGQGNRLIEVVLSSRQVGERRAGNAGARWHETVMAAGGWPAVLQERGFRLVSRFNNSNSSNDCYVFHRVPRFNSLEPANLPFDWRHEVAPRVPAAGGPGRMTAAAARPAGALRVGDRATYNNPNNRNHGNTAEITWISGDGRFVSGRWTATGADFQRYSAAGFTVTREAPAQPAPDPRRTVATISTFHNVLRAGRSEAGFPTWVAARAAAPRARQVDRKDTVVRADGTTTVNWIEGVNG